MPEHQAPGARHTLNAACPALEHARHHQEHLTGDHGCPPSELVEGQLNRVQADTLTAPRSPHRVQQPLSDQKRNKPPFSRSCCNHDRADRDFQSGAIFALALFLVLAQGAGRGLGASPGSQEALHFDVTHQLVEHDLSLSTGLDQHRDDPQQPHEVHELHQPQVPVVVVQDADLSPRADVVHNPAVVVQDQDPQQPHEEHELHRPQVPVVVVQDADVSREADVVHHPREPAVVVQQPHEPHESQVPVVAQDADRLQDPDVGHESHESHDPVVVVQDADGARDPQQAHEPHDPVVIVQAADGARDPQQAHEPHDPVVAWHRLNSPLPRVPGHSLSIPGEAVILDLHRRTRPAVRRGSDVDDGSDGEDGERSAESDPTGSNAADDSPAQPTTEERTAARSPKRTF